VPRLRRRVLDLGLGLGVSIIDIFGLPISIAWPTRAFEMRPLDTRQAAGLG
jgi:hypothetical protein